MSAAALILLFIAALVPRAFSQRVPLVVPGVSFDVSQGVDSGALPESQMLTLEIRLKPLPERAAALDELIAAQIEPGSASYRKWLTMDEFATRFGATDEQIALASRWLESQGLTVGPVSAGRTRLAVTGSAARVQASFGIKLRRYKVAGVESFANASVPTVPQEMSGLIAGVSGLDSRSATTPAIVQAISKGALTTVLSRVSNVDTLVGLEGAIDQNAASILTLTTASCSADSDAMEHESYRAALRQAEAQGITVLATSGWHGYGIR